MSIAETRNREPPSKRKEKLDGQDGKPNHTKWDCKYHVVFIPKNRRKVLYAELRKYLGEVFRSLALQKGSRIEEGRLMADHVHMMIAIPPKHPVLSLIHISEPTRLGMTSYAVFCLKKQ